jgi:hypothetical protein
MLVAPSHEAKKTIDLFLTQNDDALAVTAPEANGYEFQSSGVVEMLEKLLGAVLPCVFVF